MQQITEPRVLKGFRDILPEKELSRRHLIRKLEQCFSSNGYLPIDTPVLEYSEILFSKQSSEAKETEKQSYRFLDHGQRDVALRYDLTVPFARFTATHWANLSMPFRRYQIGKAWRGEKPQRGRYREFIQCDFDIIGTDSAAADLEIMLMMMDSLLSLSLTDFTIRFSHRAYLTMLIDKLGLTGSGIPGIIDKIHKVDRDKIRESLVLMAGEEDADTLLSSIQPEKTNRETLKKMTQHVPGVNDSWFTRIQDILNVLDHLGIGDRFVLDPSIVRGLDYYTGVVFETFLTDLPGLGSVCSGGRYDNLTGKFMKQALSGVGASVGLDRMMSAMEELELIHTKKTSSQIFIPILDAALLPEYQHYARRLRKEGFAVEIYPEERKLAQQFKYADSKDIPLALIVGQEEKDSDTVTLKNLLTKENHKNLSFREALTMTGTLLNNANRENGQ